MKGTWTQIEIAGKSVDIFDPGHETKPAFGLIHLHGIGMESLKGNAVYTELLEDLNLTCACPQGQRSWWADRICEEFDSTMTAEAFLLDEVVPFFDQQWGLKPRAIGLHGISMGGQGVLRLAFKHPKTFPAVAGIASAIDHHEVYGRGSTLDDMYDSKEQCRQDTALMHIHPSVQPPHIFFCIDPEDTDWHRGNDRLHEKLNALGVQHTCDLDTRSGGHSWDYFNSQAEPTIRFVAEGLKQESFRLL